MSNARLPLLPRQHPNEDSIALGLLHLPDLNLESSPFHHFHALLLSPPTPEHPALVVTQPLVLDLRGHGRNRKVCQQVSAWLQPLCNLSHEQRLLVTWQVDDAVESRDGIKRLWRERETQHVALEQRQSVGVAG